MAFRLSILLFCFIHLIHASIVCPPGFGLQRTEYWDKHQCSLKYNFRSHIKSLDECQAICLKGALPDEIVHPFPVHGLLFSYNADDNGGDCRCGNAPDTTGYALECDMSFVNCPTCDVAVYYVDTWSETGNTINCLPCLPGTYSPDSGISCLDCEVGQWTDPVAQGATSCFHCPAGKFWDESSLPSPCDPPRTCPVPCYNCPVGFFSEAGAHKCMRHTACQPEIVAPTASSDRNCTAPMASQTVEPTPSTVDNSVVWLKRGGCVAHKNMCVFSRQSRGWSSKACSANQAKVAYQANARLYFGKSSAPSTIPITSDSSCRAAFDSESEPVSTIPVLAVAPSLLLGAADSELLFNRFDRWPFTLNMAQEQPKVISTATRATPAVSRQFTYPTDTNSISSRRRSVPSSLGVADNAVNLQESPQFQFTQSLAIWSSDAACKKQAELAVAGSGVKFSSVTDTEVSCNEFGCTASRVRPSFLTGALETSQSTYVQHYDACMSATRRVDSEHPVPVLMYLQPPSGWVYYEYHGVPTYIPEDGSNRYLPSRFGEDSSVVLDTFVPDTHAPTPSPYKNVTCTASDHCCFRAYHNYSISVHDAASVLVNSSSIDVDSCLKRCTDYLLCRVAEFSDGQCVLYTFTMISETTVHDSSAIYAYQVDSNCRIPNDVLSNLYNSESTLASSSSYVKQDCCMHRVHY